MNTRSGGAAGRPFGRPAVTCLLALLVLGVCTVLLHPSSSSAQGEEDAAVVAATDSPPAGTEPSETAPSEPPAEPAPPPAAPVEQADDPLPEPLPSQPDWDRSATYDVPDSAAHPQSSAPEEGDGEAPAPEPEPEPAQPDAATGAYNESRVLQAILQVQVGCRTNCRGTAQDQSASQGSNTRQDATAIAPEGSSSGAVAVNDSLTMQFVWQMQLGCVAFCWDTTMNQSASQDSQTTQTATAAGDLGALALNVAATIQYIWQFQEGCAVECYGTSQSQSLSQQQSTTQAATATGPDYAGWRPDGSGAIPPWLIAFAQNLGATLQVIFQYQEASCLENCDAGTLLQEAIQQAETNQSAAAGDVPEPVTEPPAPTPPAAGEQPAASGPAPVAASAAQAPAEDRRRHRSASVQSEWRRSEPPAPRGPSSAIAGLLALAGGSDGEATPGPERDSAAPAASEPAAERTRSERPSGSAETSSAGTGGSDPEPAAVGVDTSAVPSSTDGSEFPWLTAGLLLIAALAATMALRARPGLGT